MPKSTTKLPPLPDELLSAEDAAKLKKPQPAVTADPEIPDLRASLVNVQAALQERTQERDTLKTKLDRVTFLMDALKRSYGLSPAAVILETPVDPPGASIIERFNSITDDAEKGRFYAQHKEELLKHINRGVPDQNALPDTYRW